MAQLIKKIENHYEIEIEITKNELGIDPETLFEYATRNNLKRRFLFVSSVLGKHLSVKPKNAVLTGRLLSVLHAKANCLMLTDGTQNYQEMLNEIKSSLLTNQISEKAMNIAVDVPEKTSVIAFAETATSLGHLVFDGFDNGYAFYHTTRERFEYEGNIVSFEEEHSHATSHLVYENPVLRLSDSENIVLVDDEISTGNTILNIIESLKKSYAVKIFNVLTILDLRNSDSIQKFADFEKIHGIKINVISIVKGQIHGIKNLEITLDEIKKHELFDDRLYIKETNVVVKKVEIDNFKVSNRNTNGFLDGTGRFGINASENKLLRNKIKVASTKLQEYVSGKTLVLGTEEFMFIPLMLANNLIGDISYKSTTRSPIYPYQSGAYPINSGITFKSLYNPEVKNFVYNLTEETFDTILVVVERYKTLCFDELNTQLSKVSKRVVFVSISNEENDLLSYPKPMGSYSEDDVVFLLKDVSDKVVELGNVEREKAIQNGCHYSEMLPIEYKPTEKYLEIFHSSLEIYSRKIANAVSVTAIKILKARGKNVVLVSLARAGTPAGILLKRYIKKRYNIEMPHYSISIIRGKGIDHNALRFILENHPNSEIQFIDGWTGKGAITNELRESIEAYRLKYQISSRLSYELAVLADPGNAVKLYGTREDFLIPNACLNSTISGLLSRTFSKDGIILDKDFHGAKFYRELLDEDLSNHYIEVIEKEFDHLDKIDYKTIDFDIEKEKPSWSGLQDVRNIENDFNIESIHFIKPGIGETTRVLLRRMPWKILISEDAKNIEHVLLLAKEKNITVETYPLKSYYCCGIIKSLKGE